MEQQVDVLDSLETPVEIKRNTFLTVLCILTWVGCGVMLVYYFILFSVFRLGSRVAEASNGMTSSWENEIRWAVIYYIVAAACIIPCLIGSIMIWRMKVLGFVIYVIGEGIPVLFGFFIAFNGSRLGFWELFTSIAAAVIPVGFIVMYGINLKTMRIPKDDGFN